MKIRQCPWLRFALRNLVPCCFKPAPWESSFGIPIWFCDEANFAEEQTLLLRRSARVALFLTSIRPSLSNLASHALHISDRAIPKREFGCCHHSRLSRN